jgi:hypothetical protein
VATDIHMDQRGMLMWHDDLAGGHHGPMKGRHMAQSGVSTWQAGNAQGQPVNEF